MLVSRAERVLKLHGVLGGLQHPYLHSWWVLEDCIAVYLRKDSKLDIDLLVNGDTVHVLRRYKNGRGWFEDEYAEQAMTHLARFMVLDDLADI